MTEERLGSASGGAQKPEVQKKDQKGKLRRWMIITGAVILAVFLVYLLLILIYPSMNIGMSP